jgi:hypothetical protein
VAGACGGRVSVFSVLNQRLLRIGVLRRRVDEPRKDTCEEWVGTGITVAYPQQETCSDTLLDKRCRCNHSSESSESSWRLIVIYFVILKRRNSEILWGRVRRFGSTALQYTSQVLSNICSQDLWRTTSSILLRKKNSDAVSYYESIWLVDRYETCYRCIRGPNYDIISSPSCERLSKSVCIKPQGRVLAIVFQYHSTGGFDDRIFGNFGKIPVVVCCSGRRLGARYQVRTSVSVIKSHCKCTKEGTSDIVKVPRSQEW